MFGDGIPFFTVTKQQWKAGGNKTIILYSFITINDE